MTAKAAKPIDYRALSEELEAILLELQREDLDVDQALQHYQRGLAVVEALESYLKTAENSVKSLQAKFKTGS